MKLYIIRHGETDENAQGIIQGWIDTELNANGLSQAKAAARSFTHPIDAIFSSDLKRATQTAQEFRALHAHLPYFEDSRLRERNFGDANGTHRDRHDWEQFWSNKSTASSSLHIEPLDDFSARVAGFLHDLKSKPYGAVLVVAHGGVLNRIQAILDPRHEHFSHANASVLEIDI